MNIAYFKIHLDGGRINGVRIHKLIWYKYNATVAYTVADIHDILDYQPACEIRKFTYMVWDMCLISHIEPSITGDIFWIVPLQFAVTL